MADTEDQAHLPGTDWPGNSSTSPTSARPGPRPSQRPRAEQQRPARPGHQSEERTGPTGHDGQEGILTVPIGLVPTIYSVQQVQQVPGPEGKPLVLLVVSTPVGQACYLLDPDCAIQTGQNLREAGKASKAGLIVPGP
jgi:hypothetical protein